MKGQVISASLLGFVIGMGMGLMYGKAVRSRLSESVSTNFSGGVYTVSVDTYDAISVGLFSRL